MVARGRVMIREHWGQVPTFAHHPMHFRLWVNTADKGGWVERVRESEREQERARESEKSMNEVTEIQLCFHTNTLFCNIHN